jgi:phospholipase A-2-activating protein
LYINFSVFITSAGQVSSPESAEKALVLLDELTKIATREKDSEVIYRSLVGIGTLLTTLGSEVKIAAREVYEIERVLNKVLDAGFGREPRVKSVVGEIRSAAR